MYNFILSSESRRHQEADTSLPYAVQLPDLCFVHPTDIDNPMPTFSIEIKVRRFMPSVCGIFIVFQTKFILPE